ncbi:hypothetical protein ABT364_20825 [Massilia sp. SR12]
MTLHTARGRSYRHACLAAIAGLHLAALVAWHDAPPARPDGVPQRDSALVFIQAPAAAALPPTLNLAPSLAARPRPAAIARAAPAAITLPLPEAGASGPDSPASPEAPGTLAAAPAPTLPDDPFARQPAPASGTLARARLAAASVDRQLRKESLNKFATLVDEDKADRYSINGPAYRPPPDESFADGRGIVHKRYMVRGRMVCEQVDHVSALALHSGSRARPVRCPK